MSTCSFPPVILVVDDEPMMTEMLQIILTMSLECEVVTTNSPVQALDILKSRPVSLLITDYLMPDLNGLELVKHLRAQPSMVPVIMLTGYYDNPELERHLDIGAFEIMVKPWQNDHLVARAREALAGGDR